MIKVLLFIYFFNETNCACGNIAALLAELAILALELADLLIFQWKSSKDFFNHWKTIKFFKTFFCSPCMLFSNFGTRVLVLDLLSSLLLTHDGKGNSTFSLLLFNNFFKLLFIQNNFMRNNFHRSKIFPFSLVCDRCPLVSQWD